MISIGFLSCWLNLSSEWLCCVCCWAPALLLWEQTTFSRSGERCESHHGPRGCSLHSVWVAMKKSYSLLGLFLQSLLEAQLNLIRLSSTWNSRSQGDGRWLCISWDSLSLSHGHPRKHIHFHVHRFLSFKWSNKWFNTRKLLCRKAKALSNSVHSTNLP